AARKSTAWTLRHTVLESGRLLHANLRRAASSLRCSLLVCAVSLRSRPPRCAHHTPVGALMEVRLSDEVERARATGTPIVVLESSVVAQGLPHPVNLEATRVSEEAVRQSGAVPAVVAVIDGVVRCGLSADDVRRLASGSERRWKIGVGDLASAVLQKATGGTTV